MTSPIIPTLSVVFVLRHDPSPTPVVLFTGHATAVSATHWTLTAGSLWIAADKLVPDAPAGQWAGLRIQHGDLQTSVPAIATPDGIRIPPAASFVLKFAPTQPDDTTLAALPASAVFAFPPAGRAAITAAQASISPGSGKITLTPAPRASTFNSVLERIVVPFDADATTIALNLGGPAASIAGTTSVVGAGWALPVRAMTFPGLVFDPGSGGAVLLICGDGLAATWPGLADSLQIASVNLLAEDDRLQLVSTAAGARRIPYQIPAWTQYKQTDPGVNELEKIAWVNDPFGSVQYNQDLAGTKTLTVSGSVNAVLDVIQTAAGDPLEVRCEASLVIASTPSDDSLTIQSAPIDENRAGRIALALSNALLTVTTPTTFKLTGAPDTDGALPKGSLDLTFGIYQLLPTLPDPYAANFDCVSDRRRYVVTGHLNAAIAWDGWQTPQAQFSMPLQEPPQFRQAYVPDRIEGSPADPPPASDPEPQTWLWGEFEQSLAGIPHEPRLLLDVSGNADQLGVCFALDPRGDNDTDPPLSFAGITLETFGYNVHIFAEPQVAWEPVVNVPNPNNLNFPGKGISITDGERAQVGVNTVHLVPITPSGAASGLMAAHKKGDNAAALFTLPFGMQAMAKWRPAEWDAFRVPPSLTLERPAFRALFGARHFRLVAGTIFGEQTEQPPYLPGMTVQHRNISLDLDGVVGAADLPTSVLATNTDWFTNTFSRQKPQVPILLIDLSGYGESGFSAWNNNDPPPTVSKVWFSVMNGRTAREVVQFISYLWPCHATVVRTIVMERSGGASVFRYDSGWIATTPGLFQTQPDIIFHTGAVQGMYNIREIRETSQIFKLNPHTVQAVYFDANVAIDNVVQGQNSDKRVPVRRQIGFIQLGDGGELDHTELADLLNNHGPVGGPMDCIVDVGKSGFKEHVFGLFSESVDGTNFAVVLYGMPLFVGGSWSMAHVAHGAKEGEVKAVDPHRGVPLIREKGGPAFRFADAADLLAPNPASDYALLYTGATHRVLFPRPTVTPGQTSVVGAVPGLLADPYAMISATGNFPDTDNALSFSDPTYVLDVTPAGLKTRTSMKVDQPDDRTLADTSAWALRAVYKTSPGIEVNIDPGTAVDPDNDKSWPVQMKTISTILNVPIFGDLFTVNNDMPDLGPLQPHLPSPEVILGESFSEFNKIASALQDIGLPAGLDFSLAGSGLENQTYHLRFSGKLRLATKDGDRVDLGIGKVSGELDVGGDIAANLTAAPSGRIWFDVGGDLQQAIIPGLLYAGGMLKFHIAIDEAGAIDWQLDAGTVASIGGDLLEGLVSLEATVHYAYLLTPSLKPGIRLGMDARASLADGLVGVKFGVDASVSVSRPATAKSPPIPFGDPSWDEVLIEGDVMAMGQITVAWVFDPEFSRRLHFNQTLHLKYLLFGAVTGLLPLPV